MARRAGGAGMIQEQFMAWAWRDFVLWASDQPDIRAQFEHDTGKKFPVFATSPIEKAIDDATGYGDAALEEFVVWVTIAYWGSDWAPAAMREKIAAQGQEG